MKRTNILFFIAAAALLSSLCGIFFYPNSVPASTSGITSVSAEIVAFSKDTAQSELKLCALAYDKELLGKELISRGCKDFEYFEKTQETNYSNGIAFGIAHYESDGKNYLCVVFRGTYDREWYSNFQIGEGVEHAGFAAAADFSIKSIDEYIENHKLSPQSTVVKLAGHSRGAAVSNICAKRLIDREQFKSISAYNFACPATTKDAEAQSAQYRNIYNIINPEDFICYIPLTVWDYKRYGTDIFLPDKDTEGYHKLYRSMQDKYFENTQSSHQGYPDGNRDVRRFITALSEICPTVQDYYQKEITLFPHRVTMYEYMQSAAAFLSSDQTLSHGMILLSSGTSKMFTPLSEFIMQGLSLDSMDSTDITGGAMGCAHNYDTYNAWLSILEDKYFDTFLHKE